jgi:hypothetical protein
VVEIVRWLTEAFPFPGAAIYHDNVFHRGCDVRCRWIGGTTISSKPGLVIVPKNRRAVLESGGYQRGQPIRVEWATLTSSPFFADRSINSAPQAPQSAAPATVSPPVIGAAAVRTIAYVAIANAPASANSPRLTYCRCAVACWRAPSPRAACSASGRATRRFVPPALRTRPSRRERPRAIPRVDW